MKTKIIEKFEKTIRKFCTLIVAFGVIVTSLGLQPLINAFANEIENNTKLVVQTNSNTIISIDESDGNKLVYKNGTTLVGTVKVKVGQNYITPTLATQNNRTVGNFELTKYNNETYQVTAEVRPAEGYQRQQNYFYEGSSIAFPGDNNVGLNITKNNVHVFDFSFETLDNQDVGDVPPSEMRYPILAHFEDVEEYVSIDDDNIYVPEEFTGGDVELYIKACVQSDNTGVPYSEDDTCSGTVSNVRINTILVANGEQINDTARGKAVGDNHVLDIQEGFFQYGKVTVHLFVDLMNDDDSMNDINTMINLRTEDSIVLTSEAAMSMSHSVGTLNLTTAILTNNNSGSISVFFGNSEVDLEAIGPNVRKIVKVNNSTDGVSASGVATVQFPDLSVETTTKVNLTIELNDGTTINRTVNLVRTAIDLRFNTAGGDATLEAGYVVNKAYLYNNETHNHDVFNAYLQVILYKDDVVAGYRQIEIDDEDLINELENNQSGAMEVISDQRIKLYGKALDDTIEGVNRASVFLTNGKIDADSDVLPSIEFGIGAGVEIDWEVRQ